MPNYLITTYPVLRRTYLIKDVADSNAAWDKYIECLPEPTTEVYADLANQDDIEIELVN